MAGTVSLDFECNIEDVSIPILKRSETIDKIDSKPIIITDVEEIFKCGSCNWKLHQYVINKESINPCTCSNAKRNFHEIMIYK